MRVLVAGATGALGHALIPKLSRAGHDVIGLSRSDSSKTRLELLGATHQTGDLLDHDGLHRALEAAKPDVVIHAAKAIPKRGPIFFREMRRTNELHDVGTANLLNAAIAAGSSRIIVESIVFAYGYGNFGDRPITEDHPTRAQLPRRKLAELVDGVLAMENRVLEAHASGRIGAIVLRCGIFYGPLAGTDGMVQMLRRRMMPLPGGGRARWPVVYIDDVADAFVVAASSEVADGVYNIVDDEPVQLREFMAEIARLADVSRPWSLPRTLGKVFAPYFTEVANTSMRVSNELAKTHLGWQLEHPTYRDGLAEWAEAARLGWEARAD